MTIHANRGDRVTFAHAGGVVTRLVLLERIRVAQVAGLGTLDRILAQALDVARCGGMRARVDVQMTTATANYPVDRMCKGIAR
ncbi:MAG: hypothetical protein WBO00_07615, partial [Steroidobacteraceae bacterium]